MKNVIKSAKRPPPTFLNTYGPPFPAETVRVSTSCLLMRYCKSRNFRENFIFTNSVKRHSCCAKNSRPEHDLPISVIDRVISQFREDFIFTKLRIKFRENKTLAKISEFTVNTKITWAGSNLALPVSKKSSLTYIAISHK